MMIKKLINIPIKNILIAIVIFVVIFIMLRLPQLTLLRIYNAECNGVVTCMNAQMNENLFIGTVLGDLTLVTRILIELGLIFVVIQLVGRAFHRT